VFRQRARIGSRIRERLVLFVQRLRERKRRARRESEAAVGFALQARQIVEKRRDLRRRLRLFADDAGLARAFFGERVRSRFAPQPLGAQIGIVFLLLEFLVEPAAVVFAAFAPKASNDFPVVARLKSANLFFAL